MKPTKTRQLDVRTLRAVARRLRSSAAFRARMFKKHSKELGARLSEAREWASTFDREASAITRKSRGRR